MQKIFILITTLLAGMASTAQTRVSGTVTDAQHKPAAFATVMLLHAKDSSLAKGTVTDSAGHYWLSGVKAGRYLIAASGVGAGKCYSAVFTANSAGGAISIPLLRLREAPASLKGVEVTARKPYIEMLADKMVLNVEDNPISAGNSLFDVLRRAPSVRVDQHDNFLLLGNGVSIWIDGRPSNMSGETLAQWLKTQPADIVSRIEIIANPSARFDAAGGGGIINIKLKKRTQQGLNGSVYAGGGMGKYGRANTGLNMNFREGRFNVYGNYGFYYSESYNLLNFNSITQKPDGQYDRLNRENYWHPFSRGHNLKAGVDYSMTDKTTLGFIANLGTNGTNSRTDGVTGDFSDGNPQPSWLRAFSAQDDRNDSYRFNLNLLSNLDTLGSTFVVDADIANYDKDLQQSILNYLNKGSGEQEIANIQNLAPSMVSISSLKADYSKVFSKAWQLETGAKASYVKTDSDIRFDSLLNQQWERDKLRSNRFRYTENLQAAYVSLHYDHKQWNFKAGLRVERTDAEGYSVTLDSLVRNRYINFFPSVFILRRFNGDQQLTLSYGKRIDRPSYSLLNPFSRAIDPYTFIEGNPYLKPQFNHVFQLRHSFHQWLHTTVYYNFTKDYSGSVIYSEPDKKIFTTRSENIGRGHYGYVAVTVYMPAGKWLESETNIGAGMARYISVLPGQEFDNRGGGAEMSTNLTFILPYDVKLQAAIGYNTAAPSGQNRNRAMWGTDFGVQKSIWKKQGSIRLNIADPFNTRRYDADITTGLSQIHWVNRWESRRINISITRKFGNQQIKAARSRNTGAKDEENRVN